MTTVLSGLIGAPGRRDDIRDEDITGLKSFYELVPLFEPLHEIGCQRDKVANRRLHCDEYCLLLLVFLFSSVVTSLRPLQQASELKEVQRELGCKRASLDSLSESAAVGMKTVRAKLAKECRLQLRGCAVTVETGVVSPGIRECQQFEVFRLYP